MADIGTDINRAMQILNSDELIAIPTETVYGLAGNALNENSILKIFQVKDRPFFDPLIVHTNNLERITDYVKYIPDILMEMANALMPGPFTIILEKTKAIPDLVTSGSDKVAFRIPNHPLSLKLLAELSYPLAAPSANPFGYISPTTAKHVQDQLGHKIEYILDGGECAVGLESTIVEWKENKLHVLRKGGITIESLLEYTKEIEILENSSSNPIAPGMLKSHYAPKIPVMISPPLAAIGNYNIERIGVLAFQKTRKVIPLENQLILSKSGDLNEAARNLFAYMRILDSMDIDLIITELFPEIGLGRAINDKLRRAATV